MRKGNLSEDTDKESLENEEIEDCLNQQCNVYMTKQRQLEKKDGNHNLSWKHLKDKYKMNFRVNFVTMLQRK